MPPISLVISVFNFELIYKFPEVSAFIELTVSPKDKYDLYGNNTFPELKLILFDIKFKD